jgi:hypothetical protein
MTDNLIMGRKEHAVRINEAWQKTVDGIVETGLRIHDARTGQHALPHGTFQEMVRDDLHFTPRTAQRLMAIASNEVLSNTTHVSHLPASWGTLYELSVIGDKGYDLEAGIQSGAIHPKMERKDVKALLPPPQRYDDLEETSDTDEEGADTFAADDDMPTEAEAEASYQTTLYDQACLFLEEMTGETRRRLFAHIKEKYDAEAAPKKRGRPKGRKNKPRAVVEPTAAEVTDQAAADVSVLPNNDGLGIPDFLRRTPAAS